MHLAEALHHSAGPSKLKVVERHKRQEEAGSETYYAPRRPKTLPPGMRPAPPSEVARPQVVAATGGYVAAGAPLLAVSSLRGADGVDDTAVQFLLRAELKKKKEEEEDERKQELADEELDEKLDAEMDALMAVGPERLTSRQNARLSAILRERAELIERKKRRRTMRKKKKRKKRLPRIPLPRQGRRRPCAHLRQVPAVQRVLSSSSSTTFGHSCWAAETGTHSANFTIQVQFLGKGFVPVVVQRQVCGPVVQKTVVSRSCSPSNVVDCRRVGSPWSSWSEDHRGSSIAVR